MPDAQNSVIVSSKTPRLRAANVYVIPKNDAAAATIPDINKPLREDDLLASMDRRIIAIAMDMSDAAKMGRAELDTLSRVILNSILSTRTVRTRKMTIRESRSSEL